MVLSVVSGGVGLRRHLEDASTWKKLALVKWLEGIL
jgi:hypothetical protein